MSVSVISVEDLTVAYRQGSDWLRVVENVSFAIGKGEVFGLVGESGCGKSTMALQALGFHHPTIRVERGAVNFDNRNLTALPRSELDAIRGRRISFVPQNPTTALNPGIRVGEQVSEILTAHAFPHDIARVTELFALVGLPANTDFLRRYPHQLSGGQQQRVCIAMALACDPELVVLDEPTTGLDVTTQEQIVVLLAELRARLGMSMLYVTHDLALLSQLANRIGVMYAGRLVEVASAAVLFSAPRHPYSQGLIASIPAISDGQHLAAKPLRGFLQRKTLPPGCPFAPRCDHAQSACADNAQMLETIDAGHQVACWRWRDIAVERRRPSAEAAVIRRQEAAPLLTVESLSVSYGKGQKSLAAVNDVFFSIHEGETLALVGESGSGKSTIARAISGLTAPVAGRILLGSQPLAPSIRGRSTEERRLVQFIFQNPDASLNPRARIATTLARPIEFFFPKESAQRKQHMAEALDGVRLDVNYAERFPDQLSGGERQRIAIARALIARPALLLCDEILSALDVSVQASILALLQKLKRDRRIAMLFISHDLAVVRMVADRIAVLFRGEIMEIGTAEQVFHAPFHPYTYSLLQAVPAPLKRRSPETAKRRVVDATVSQAGCVYAGRCAWQAGTLCETIKPPWQETPGGLRIHCHLPPAELAAKSAGLSELKKQADSHP